MRSQLLGIYLYPGQQCPHAYPHTFPPPIYHQILQVGPLLALGTLDIFLKKGPLQQKATTANSAESLQSGLLS